MLICKGKQSSVINYLKQQYSGKTLLRIAATQSEYFKRNSRTLGIVTRNDIYYVISCDYTLGKCEKHEK